MSDKTSIEWTDATWNPVRGCSRLSPGCGGANRQGGCYAEKIAARFSGPGQPFEGFAERSAHGGRWTGKMALVDDMLTLPLRWKKPRRIFVNSMSDLFHENLPDEAIDKVFAVIALAPQHTFQVLTKRSARMRAYFGDAGAVRRIIHEAFKLDQPDGAWLSADHEIAGDPIVPLPNVWLGVSVEDRARKTRIDDLRATPAAIRFLSCEPLLEGLGELDLSGIHQVIIGGESGPRSRSFMLSWAASIVAQCANAGVAAFMKQLGAEAYDDRSYVGSSPRYETKDRKGGDWSEWPADLRVREFPT